MTRPIRSRPHRVFRLALLVYLMISVAVALISLFAVHPEAPFAASAGGPGTDAFSDPADDWSRFNQGTTTEQPSWSGDAFLAAVAHAVGGQIVRMPGAQTYLDASVVSAATRGSNLLVVVTPPTPLGAVQTTRARDNTAQESWANPRKLRLIMVHGQEVYLPYASDQDLLAATTPGSGLPMREGMRTADATDSVLKIVQEELADRAGKDDVTVPDPPGSDAYTAAALALTGARPPTAAELRPVEAALDRADLYADPSITPAPTFKPAWSAVGQGREVKVVLLPYADPTGPPVDWTGALARRYPNAVVLVMTGKWIESAGTNRQTMVDSIIATYNLGGFSFAASAPAFSQTLDWVTGIDAAAVSSHAFARPLPRLPDTAFPRWIAYLLLGTAAIIAAGFGISYWLDRRRSARQDATAPDWPGAAVGGLAGAYLQLSSAPFVGPGGPSTPAPVQRRLDAAYATLLELHGTEVGDHAERLVQSAWSQLDVAAGALVRPDLGPSASLPAALRHAPRPRSTPGGPGLPVRGAPARHWRRLVPVAAVGILLLITIPRLITTGTADHSFDLTQLRTSNIGEFSAPRNPAAATLASIVGNRALFVVQLGDARTDDADELADQIVETYPDAVAFVLTDGDIEGASIGGQASTSGYDENDFLDDYYDQQNTATGDVAVTRQLALLYDRLGAGGSIRVAQRSVYDAPATPWLLIAAGLVLAMLAAAVLIRFAVRRVVTGLELGQDEQAERTALTLRLAGAASHRLTAARDPDPGNPDRTTRIAQLAGRISHARSDQFDELSTEIDDLLDGAGTPAPKP